MEELFNSNMTATFGSNLLTIFIVTFIVIISYTNFTENQQISIIYLIIFGLAFIQITRIWVCLLLLLVSTFVFLEYLTQDTKKLELITRFDYKILDYLFLMFFQLHVTLLLIALLLLFVSHVINKSISPYVMGSALLSLIICEHKLINQSFKVKSISGLYAPFSKHPYYNFKYSEDRKQRYELICSIEDATYFKRKKSYSTFSFEYLKIRFTLRKVLALILFHLTSVFRKRSKSTPQRGYSCPEMQLIRTAGVLRGYEKYKYSRKVYEVIYSKIFFSSLYNYQQNNSGIGLKHFRSYIMDVYLKTVLSKVKESRFLPLSDAFEDSDNVESWPLEALFVLGLGLSFREADNDTLELYSSVIQNFDLDLEKIQDYSTMLQEMKTIPSNESIATIVEF